MRNTQLYGVRWTLMMYSRPGKCEYEGVILSHGIHNLDTISRPTYNVYHQPHAYFPTTSVVLDLETVDISVVSFS